MWRAAAGERAPRATWLSRTGRPTSGVGRAAAPGEEVAVAILGAYFFCGGRERNELVVHESVVVLLSAPAHISKEYTGYEV